MLFNTLNSLNLETSRLKYLVSGHSQSENDNAQSVIEVMARKKTLYTPLDWGTLIQCAFIKNKCTFTVLEHHDIKNPTAFPEYSKLYADKTTEEMTPVQKDNQIALNVSLGLQKRKPDKIFWSEIVDIMFKKSEPEVVFFKFKYDENFRKATFSARKRNQRRNGKNNER